MLDKTKLAQVKVEPVAIDGLDGLFVRSLTVTAAERVRKSSIINGKLDTVKLTNAIVHACACHSDGTLIFNDDADSVLIDSMDFNVAEQIAMAALRLNGIFQPTNRGTVETFIPATVS